MNVGIKGPPAKTSVPRLAGIDGWTSCKLAEMKPHLSILIAILSLASISSLWARDPERGGGDKTGTNPINFTNDLRVYNEYQWLDTGSDLWANFTTLEFRTPFAHGKWQFRTRLRASALDVGSADVVLETWTSACCRCPI